MKNMKDTLWYENCLLVTTKAPDFSAEHPRYHKKVKTLITPRKINIEPENFGLEDDFPFPEVYSQVPC